MSEQNSPELGIILSAFEQVKKAKYLASDKAAFDRCENYRKELLQNQEEITYEIFNSDHRATVQDICAKAASSSSWCRFLYFIVKSIAQPAVLEIGTNVGMSGSYILEAMPDFSDSKFRTMEGLPQLCELSRKQFAVIKRKVDCKVIQGLYENTFPDVLQEDIQFNALFIDGNHQKEPTLHYFKELKKKAANPAIFIFDDINWSEGMQEAWMQIRTDPEVNYSIDLYEQGIVIIDKSDQNRNVDFELHLSY